MTTPTMMTVAETAAITVAAAAAAAGGRADGVVWGRHQAAKAAEMGINRKWEQCGYNLYRKTVTWVTFYMYPTAFPGYKPNFSFVRGESHFVFGSLRDPPSY